MDVTMNVASNAGGNPVGEQAQLFFLQAYKPRSLMGFDRGRSLLDAVQADEGLSRPAEYAFKAQRKQEKAT